MRTTELTCIRCPVGCALSVTVDADGTVVVTGNRCARGRDYGASEATNPVRTVTANIAVPGCLEPLSTKTTAPVPKALVREVASAITALELELPIQAGDVLCEDICGTGVSVVATKSLR